MLLSSKQFLMLWNASLETLYMVSVTTVLTVIMGIPLGVLLVVTRPGHILQNKGLYRVVGFLVNATRSIPFPIFIVFVIPLTRFIVHTSVGVTAVIVPLTLAAFVFLARLTETALLEVPHGVVEAAKSMGASNGRIIWRVLLPEAWPGLVMAVTITIITLISYSAMAGAIGGGGLGDLAIRYGYHRYQKDIMWVTVIMLIIVVQLVQSVGDWLVRRHARR
ncbi:MAG: ABC transporter permease [Deltaproteobacteria bacterium]|jgi:ABC-type methionine transport system permease subunit|nr:ABC transporter permease [Deltaproteobacteria bacterium]